MSLLTIFAAASLTTVFPHVARAPRYQFAGSDQLAFQIAQGARADVFAAASPKQPQALYRQGLCSKPRVFATNRLVLIVPRSNPAHIHSVYDLRRRGVKLVVGARGVPVGDYTRKLLADLRLSSVSRQVVSYEDDVKLVVAKVALGEADAGIAYRTDVKPARGKVLSIALPARAQPVVKYELCVVHGARHPGLAASFVRKVLGSRGRRVLRAAGFGLP
ncbi:MAG: molybdate ABC transporter substrate-binding protein [Gaiellaceae bacterium]